MLFNLNLKTWSSCTIYGNIRNISLKHAMVYIRQFVLKYDIKLYHFVENQNGFHARHFHRTINIFFFKMKVILFPLNLIASDNQI